MTVLVTCQTTMWNRTTCHRHSLSVINGRLQSFLTHSILVYLLFILLSCSVLSNTSGDTCVNRSPETEKLATFYKSTPKGGANAGEYQLVDVDTFELCVDECCATRTCDVALFLRDKCYFITCNKTQSAACDPRARTGKSFRSTIMVDVRLFRQPVEPTGEKDVPDYIKNAKWEPGGRAFDTSCVYGLEHCEDHEECILESEHKKIGLCNCVVGYSRDNRGYCVQQQLQQTVTSSSSLKTAEKTDAQNEELNEKKEVLTTTEKLVAANSASTPAVAVTTTPQPFTTTVNKMTTTLRPTGTTVVTTAAVMQLTVTAGDAQTIQLPENSATLSVYVVPAAANDETYTYQWSLEKHPDGTESGVMQGKNTATLKLTNLIAGAYKFKVVVSGPGKYGEAYADITVLPAKRKNKAPIVVITPKYQKVQLPSSVVLDGSASTDDDEITHYKWEEVSGPLGDDSMNSITKDKNMLVLDKLTPGEYKFKLTVVDSDRASNSTFANVTVIKEIDYKPVANAGQTRIISLPQNSITLYGNASTDDHGIVSYEWINKGDNKLTADMQGTRTSTLRLSHLEVGDYTFQLKVTDTAGQISAADVHVIVQREHNKPPEAKVVHSSITALPDTTVTLDGSASSDDQRIVSYAWKKVKGADGVILENGDKQVATASHLSEGQYEFKLTVTDEENLRNSAIVQVTVKKALNEVPKADAGGDQLVTLPTSLITLDGSKSTDDKGIASFRWTRDDQSLAAGDIVNGSDHQVALLLTNVVPGRYIFILKVSDAEGLTSSSTATVIVKPDADLKNLIEVHLGADLGSFTQSKKKLLRKQIAMLLHSQNGDSDVNIVNLLQDSSGRLIVQFYVHIVGTDQHLQLRPGPEIVDVLRRRIRAEKDILDYEVYFIDTVICQNNCSGHGQCEQSSRRCICDPFWMTNIFKSHLWFRQQNCDWSILYVVIVTFLLAVTFGGLVWGAICCIRRYRKYRPKKRHRYQLLPDEFENANKDKLELLPSKMQHSSLMVSGSDTEEETLFVNHRKSNGYLRKNSTNGVIKHKNKYKT
ncbi:dyslexia-associated protein KIAA0319-like protein isoform X2 [Tubulanus polymorphus]|uniref:dyslexia-associated protein KIAA0319-like protein isoform X2 n=1 Tax=Tubulanus polymorphus TaxID=672921 RepID=UPI003DA60620